MLIPWILHGPGVKQGHEIAEAVRIYDTCATLAHVLGCDAHPEWDGRVIADAFL